MWLAVALALAGCACYHYRIRRRHAATRAPSHVARYSLGITAAQQEEEEEEEEAARTSGRYPTRLSGPYDGPSPQQLTPHDE